MPWLGRTFSASFLVACEIVFQAQAPTGCIESQLRRALGVRCDVIRLLLRELWRARDNAGMRPVDLLERAHAFKNVWGFELDRGGWRGDISDRPGAGP